MPSVLTNTPLSALKAVVLDTETTGLDVKQARVIEIGIAGHGLSMSWSSLIKPDAPIPQKSTVIHGIDNAMVAQVPHFREAWQEALALIGDHVVIGHSLGFDLAILKRECERAALPWQEPVWLDTRFLAIVLDAKLPDFTVGALCSWLDLPVMANHRALADAQATSAVFSAMIPRLREKGIHTFGEALAACQRIQTMSENLARAGWSEPPHVRMLASNARNASVGQSGGFDAYPFQHRVETLMSQPPAFLSAKATVGSALKHLAERQISSLFVGHADDPAKNIGIITERDILRILAKDGVQALEQEVGAVASRPLVTIRDAAYVYRAIATMARKGIRHLAVVGDDNGKVIGALSQRDLLRLRAQSSLILENEIDIATNVAELGRAWAKLPAMARSLLDEGIFASDIAGIIAREVGALTRQAALLAEQAMIDSGKGAAPASYAVLVLGSAGRGESLLAMDQDNAIVFAEGIPDSLQDHWFAELGFLFASILDEVGVPFCKGGVMAREPSFRGSLSTWRERMETWLNRSNPEDLLNVDIVFDARTVHGDPTLFSTLLDDFRTSASESPAFLKLMIASHPDTHAPLSFFGNLKGDEEGRLDLKRHLVSRVVAAARVLAIRHRQKQRSTGDRLAAIQRLDGGSLSNLDEVTQAYARAQGLVMRSQLADIAEGKKPDNRILLSTLSPLERTKLKADLSSLSVLGEVVRSAVF